MAKNHGMEEYMSTMSQRGRVTKQVLRVGQRLADGTTYTGDYKLSTLVQKKERLLKQAQEIQDQLEKVTTEIAEITGGKDPSESAPGNLPQGKMDESPEVPPGVALWNELEANSDPNSPMESTEEIPWVAGTDAANPDQSGEKAEQAPQQKRGRGKKEVE
jgi:hypothetical protein